MTLPEVFCWTKFGAEAGEAPGSIIARKERERRMNNGTFLWGIGNSIGPSITALVSQCLEPEVIFSPMLSQAAQHDSAPETVLLWRRATGADGSPYKIPAHSFVTSRLSTGRKKHYALVCGRNKPLKTGQTEGFLNSSALSNLVSGNSLGSSQVTSVVRRKVEQSTAPSKYQIALRCRLIYPFMITLTDPIEVPASLRIDSGSDAIEASSKIAELLRLSKDDQAGQMAMDFGSVAAAR